MIIVSMLAFYLKFKIFEIPSIVLKIPSISNSICKKPIILNFSIWNTGFSIKTVGFFIWNTRFLLEILVISKVCDNRVPYIFEFAFFRYDRKTRFSWTHFMPMFSLYTPWKHQKTSGFLIPLGGLKKD